MAQVGKLIVVFYQRFGGGQREFQGVYAHEYEKLDLELKSGGGYHTFQLTMSGGGKATLDKRGIATVEYYPTGTDAAPEPARQSPGLVYRHPRR